MLECCNCKSRVLFRPHPNLETDTVKKLAQEFKHHLESESHKDYCGWRNNPSLPFGDISPSSLLGSYASDVHQISTTLSKYPEISSSFIDSLQEFDDLGQRMLQKADVVEPICTKFVISCILTLCGWKSKQKDTIYCTYCQRDIGIWNYVHCEDTDGLEDEYLVLFKNVQIRRRKERVDFLRFGRAWGTPRPEAVQEARWGWGSSIPKIEPQGKFNTIIKEPLHPVEAHRWFCPFITAQEEGGKPGWWKVFCAVNADAPSLEAQGLEVLDSLNSILQPPSKKLRVGS